MSDKNSRIASGIDRRLRDLQIPQNDTLGVAEESLNIAGRAVEREVGNGKTRAVKASGEGLPTGGGSDQ